MALDLEQYLQTLRGAGQDLGQAFERLGAGQKQQALASTYAQAPSLIEQGDVMGLGSQLASLGDPEILRNELQAQIKAKKEPRALGVADLTAMGLPAKQAEVLSKLSDPSSQLSAANQYKQNQISQGNLSLSQKGQQRLEREEGQKQRNKLQDLTKLERKFQTDQDKLQTASLLLKQDNAISDNAVAFFLARQIQGGGVLSESDINAFKAKVGENVFNEVSNYLSGETKGTLNMNQKKALEQLSSSLKEKVQAERDVQLMSSFENALVDNPMLVKNGKIDPSLKKRMDRYGFSSEVAEDGSVSIFKPLSKTRSDVPKEGQAAKAAPETSLAPDMQAKISSITNPAMKKAVLTAIQGRSPEQVRVILERAGVK